MEKNKFGFITKFWSETGSAFYLEMRGRKNLTVGGCLGISEYSDSEIRLAIYGGTVSVKGNGLLCDSYTNGAVAVSGNITGIELLGDNNGSL